MGASTNPVCGICGLEMAVDRVGVDAIYMAHHPPQPYEVRTGDLCKCDNCGATVLTKWATVSKQEHDGIYFDQRIEMALATDRYVVVWERRAQSDMYHGLATEMLREWLAKRSRTSLPPEESKK
jgi:hypothetical protein